VRDEHKRPTEWIDLVGQHANGERSVRVRYSRLREQMETHLRWHHGTSLADSKDYEQLRHTTMRAAVALLMD
jgi:hypothetical protein